MKSSISLKYLKLAALLGMSLVFIISSCSKSSTPVTPVVTTSLSAEIDTANAWLGSTTEGTKPGEYNVGSKATLTTAITSAQTVLSSSTSTQSDITNATANLQAAVAVYKGNQIQQIAASSLIGYWKMNGNANDSSGNGNNGVLTVGAALYGAGTPTPIADRFGNPNGAYHFDHGANIDVPYTAALNSTQMSISLWIRWSSAGRTWDPTTYTMVAMNRWNGYKFQLQGANLPQYTVKVVEPAGDTTIYDRATNTTTPIPENTWAHLVVTYQAGVESYYIDGQLVVTWDAASSRPVPGTPIKLLTPIDFVIGQDLPTNVYTTSLATDPNGNYYVNWGGFFTGDMDDVMYYNVALTSGQVQSIYNNQNTQ